MINKLFILTLSLTTINNINSTNYGLSNFNDRPLTIQTNYLGTLFDDPLFQRLNFYYDNNTSYKIYDFTGDVVYNRNDNGIYLLSYWNGTTASFNGFSIFDRNNNEILYRSGSYFSDVIIEFSEPYNDANGVLYDGIYFNYTNWNYTINPQISSSFHIDRFYPHAYASIYNNDYFAQVTLTGLKPIFRGFFVSNGHLYTSIEMSYLDANGTRYTTSRDSSTTEVVNNSNLSYCNAVYYRNSFKSQLTNVQSADTKQVKIGSDIQWAYNGGLSWISYAYSDIYVISYDYTFKNDLPLTSNLNSIEMLLYNPNNINTLGGGSTNGVLNNTFTLLKGAFGSVSTFLNMQVFPGISLGLLVFMPFIAGLIVILVKVFKKG